MPRCGSTVHEDRIGGTGADISEYGTRECGLRWQRGFGGTCVGGGALGTERDSRRGFTEYRER